MLDPYQKPNPCIANEPLNRQGVGGSFRFAPSVDKTLIHTRPSSGRRIWKNDFLPTRLVYGFSDFGTR